MTDHVNPILTPFTDLTAAIEEADYLCMLTGKTFAVVEGVRLVRGIQAMHVVDQADSFDFKRKLHTSAPSQVTAAARRARRSRRVGMVL